MIEIIVGAWLGGLVLSILVTTLNVRYAIKLARSKSYTHLNSNLAKIEKYWSLTTESFKDLREGAIKDEEWLTIRNYIFMGLLGFLGILGFIFLAIISFSMQFLAKSRFTRRVFHSELTRTIDLTSEQVAQIVAELQSTN